MESTIVNKLITALGKEKVLTNEAVKERYHHIWRMNEPLQAKAVVLPRSTQDIAAVLKLCNEHQQTVIVHGGLTNLVGSTETSKDEIVIAMEKMNTAWTAASQDIYAATQEANGGAGNPESGADAPTDGKEEVTDVEFEEVDDKS